MTTVQWGGTYVRLNKEYCEGTTPPIQPPPSRTPPPSSNAGGSVLSQSSGYCLKLAVQNIQQVKIPGAPPEVNGLLIKGTITNECANPVFNVSLLVQLLNTCPAPQPPSTMDGKTLPDLYPVLGKGRSARFEPLLGSLCVNRDDEGEIVGPPLPYEVNGVMSAFAFNRSNRPIYGSHTVHFGPFKYL